MKKLFLAILIAVTASAIAPVAVAEECVNCDKAVGMAAHAIIISKKADNKATKAELDASMAKREVREAKSDLELLDRKVEEVSLGNAEVQKKALETTTKSLEIIIPDALSSDDDEDLDFVLPKVYRCPGEETVKVVLGKKITYRCRSPQWRSRRERYRAFRAASLQAGGIDDHHTTTTTTAASKSGNTLLAVGAGLGTFAVLTASGATAGYFLGQVLFPQSLDIRDNGNGTATVDYSAGGSNNMLGIGLSAGAGLGVVIGSGVATLVYASGLGAEE